MEKQIRFRDLARDSGQPEIVTLWTDPTKDRKFLRAVKQNRVLTVIQQPGAAKRDYGEIGFKRHEPGSQNDGPHRAGDQLIRRC